MRVTLNRRLSMLTVLIIGVGVLLLARVASFQFQLDMVAYLQNVANNRYTSVADQLPERGVIYDRNGELLAANTTEYMIGVSPIYISDKPKTAHNLAAALNLSESAVLDKLNSKAQYVLLTDQPVSAQIANKVQSLQIFGVVPDPRPRRIYPHGSLAANVIGFVGGDSTTRRGYVGVEGYYNNDLAGQSRITEQSRIPFEVIANTQPPPGRDIKLTIDRSIQYLAETELQDALTKYGAATGSIIITNPRTGEILAMASYPNFDPNQYYKAPSGAIRNPAVSDVYEPGSVFKIVTLSIALRSGKVTPNSTYIDQATRVVGGQAIHNWDGAGHGSQSFVDILVKSWNIGTTWLAVDILGWKDFYKGLKDFGVGSRTGVDMEGEEPGILRTPLNTSWSDTDLATNSFGQGISVTPLQMISFANTIANGGVMMQPHIRLETIEGNKHYPAVPAPVRNPISPQVAKAMTDIMVKVVSDPNGEGHNALVPDYTIAGKTGTAQIYNPQIGAYDPILQEDSFIGFLPADEPRVSILIKLDRIPSYASESAAPAFAQLVKRLVVLMNIPTDAQRQLLKAQGGNTALIASR